jgi:cyclic-di-AMP phosphodiesterase PgpH
MFFSKKKNKDTRDHLKSYIRSNRFQRIAIGIIAIIIVFIIIQTVSVPKKYKVTVDSNFDYKTSIIAPRDIENKILTEKNRGIAESEVKPVTKEISAAPIEVLNNVDDFFTALENERKGILKSLQDQSITEKSKNYKKQLSNEQDVATTKLVNDIKKVGLQGVPLSIEQVHFLVSTPNDDEISMFKQIIKDLLSNIMKQDIVQDDLANKIYTVQNSIQSNNISQDLKNIGGLLVKAVMEPNRTIDFEMTNAKKKEAHDSPLNIVKIMKDSKIVSYGDKVTEDIVQILVDLNLVETNSRFDFGFSIGLLIIILLLATLLIMFMNHFCKEILRSRNDVILLSVIIVLMILIASAVSGYLSPLAIPIFIATMLISILLNLELAIVVNCTLAFAISFITKFDIEFIYMAIISGTFAAFIVSRANQRSKLSMAGIFIGIVNVLVVVCFGIINKSDLKLILFDSRDAFLNGVTSIIITIGLLPFFESTFNIITPLKLLELANPNQKLIKRLLMEAPGTYHHSLMVGNLAEVATEEIGGDALLARVGAYFHDVGKLKRPNFFKENQLSDNPHDRMTANLSTLVITSHTRDGVELAEKYKIPLAIREIIKQHHGTTLVAYFYYKAKKGEKSESVRQDSFRYEGPRPSSKEAAVVMLADSVEAAVRSMIDKTEGKIEGLVRKIIKDKLDDGQLDLCSLTLRDLDNIAKAFMRVLSGYFHEREEYPEVKIRETILEEIKIAETLKESLTGNVATSERSSINDDLN